MNQNAKIDLLYQMLGIFDGEAKSLVLNEIFQKIEGLRKIAEFNALLISELIQSDMIPPIILKKTELKAAIKEKKEQIDRLGRRVDLLKSMSAPESELTKASGEIVKEYNLIEELERQLKTIEDSEPS